LLELVVYISFVTAWCAGYLAHPYSENG